MTTTPEDLSKTPMFKIIRRSLMRKFPFVIDVIPPDDPNVYGTTWFLIIKIDAVKANETMDLGGMSSWLEYKNELGVLASKSPYLTLIFKDYAKASELQKEMERDIYNIQISDITREFRLPKKFDLGELQYELP